MSDVARRLGDLDRYSAQMHNQKTSLASATTCLITSSLAALVCYLYLPLQANRYLIVLGLVVGGVGAAFIVHAVIRRLPDRRWIRATILGFVVLTLLSPAISMAIHRVTYAQFGLTVFGVIPIPALDVTVNENGILWFRKKTHRITSSELKHLISEKVEIVVIGIGWDSVAQLDTDVILSNPTIEFHVLPTPDAFKLYNSLIAEGRNVILLAHSTC